VAELGIYNSLAQLLIKITAPGIPDFYQGTELWELSLVDPDNRRPVDYAVRRSLLEGFAGADSACVAESLLETRTDGRVKLWTMARALGARTAMRDVFEEGDYVPLRATGAKQASMFAFARRLGDRMTITCVPRLVATLVGEARTPPLGSSIWEDTRIDVPDPQDERRNPRFRNVFTGHTLCACDGSIEAAKIFERFPVGLLVSE
jgi:(1->4)-alpha-D-glucan 1-alpha-D-glucosylmutase